VSRGSERPSLLPGQKFGRTYPHKAAILLAKEDVESLIHAIVPERTAVLERFRHLQRGCSCARELTPAAARLARETCPFGQVC
jgi:hypothetical protein